MPFVMSQQVDLQFLKSAAIGKVVKVGLWEAGEMLLLENIGEVNLHNMEPWNQLVMNHWVLTGHSSYLSRWCHSL